MIGHSDVTRATNGGAWRRGAVDPEAASGAGAVVTVSAVGLGCARFPHLPGPGPSSLCLGAPPTSRASPASSGKGSSLLPFAGDEPRRLVPGSGSPPGGRVSQCPARGSALPGAPFTRSVQAARGVLSALWSASTEPPSPASTPGPPIARPAGRPPPPTGPSPPTPPLPVPLLAAAPPDPGPTSPPPLSPKAGAFPDAPLGNLLQARGPRSAP